MASVNRVILVGYLGRDPETRYMPDGNAITNVSIATSFGWTDKQSGEKKEETEWHRVVFRGKLAEVAGEYLKKGSQVYVEGRIKTRKWQDKDGNDRYSTEIISQNLTMLGSRPNSSGDTREENTTRDTADTGKDRQRAAEPKPAPAQAKKPAGRFDDLEDDIPF